MSEYVKVPYSIQDELWFTDDRELASWLRSCVAEGRELNRRRRPYLSQRLWTAILERFGYACAYCGSTDVKLQKEHVIPYSKGGKTDATNIVPACQPCNLRKFDQVWSVVWP